MAATSFAYERPKFRTGYSESFEPGDKLRKSRWFRPIFTESDLIEDNIVPELIFVDRFCRSVLLWLAQGVYG